MKEYQPHQQRVIDEKSELDEKLTKLNVFLNSELFAKLTDKERGLLRIQVLQMSGYSKTLAHRIDLF